MAERFFDPNFNHEIPSYRKNLVEIKKLVEKGGIAEASTQLYDIYNKMNNYDEDKILNTYNLSAPTLDNLLTSGYELVTKQHCDGEVDSDSYSVDYAFTKKEKLRLLETEVKISKYQKVCSFQNDFSVCNKLSI